jgi:hypothetical protein
MSTTIEPPTRTTEPARRPARTQVLARRPGQGWAQAAVLIVATAFVLRHYEVSLPDTARFLLYVTAGITVPGTLLWRLVLRRPAPLAEDLAAGTALGYGLEVLTYLAARAAGLPLLVLVWPLATIVAFIAVPSLRGFWRRSAGPAVDAPWWWSWSVSAGVGFLVFWSCAEFFRSTRIGSPGYAAMDYDMPFQLAIVGEVKHHVPPRVPWVISEPLYYHWFVHAEIAATSWVTGIEPQLLLYRLSPLPMLAVLAVLIGALARRMSGAWWAAPVAVGGTFVVLAPNPVAWPLGPFFRTYGFGALEDGSLLRPTLWNSTTQTFGCTLSVLLVWVLVELLRAPNRRLWAAFGIMLAAVMGAKATYLPLLLGGLGLAVAVQLLVHRRLHRTAAIAGGVVAAATIFAQFVLFGGVSQGLVVQPFGTIRTIGVASTTGFVGPATPLWRTALIAALCLAGWACIWAGAAGLVRRRRLLEPDVLLLTGVGLAGAVGLLAFMHPGLSQYFFFESARPYLAVLAACGFVSLAGRHPARHFAIALAGFAAAGAVTVWLVRLAGSRTVPSLRAVGRPVAVAVQIGWPYATLAAVAAAAAVLLVVAHGRYGVTRSAGLALVLAMLTGFGLPSAVDQVRLQALTSPNLWRRAVMRNMALTPGTKEAGRWLRDHSDPNDIVATNAHCRSTYQCDNHHFSVAAFTERRVLFESMGYTARSFEIGQRIGVNPGNLPFWDPVLQADNDAVFQHPSTAAVGRLRDRYHVRWLFADEANQPPSPRLDDFARLRFRAGECAIYEL